MRVLHVNCVYGRTSTGRITQWLHEQLLLDEYDSYVAYGVADGHDNERVFSTQTLRSNHFWKICATISGRTLIGSQMGTHRLKKLIEDIKPEIVHIQCVNGFVFNVYELLNYLSKKKINVIITLHAEFMYTGGCGYSLQCIEWKSGCKKCPNIRSKQMPYLIDQSSTNCRLMKNSLENHKKLRVVGVSRWISRRASESYVMNNCSISTICNGIDTLKFNKQRDLSIIQNKYEYLKDTRVKVLFVTKNLNDDAKGGKNFKKLISMVDKKKFLFVVLGCIENDMSENVKMIAHTNSQDEIVLLYNSVDVTVILSEMDNYPTVGLESQACGTPVVTFDVGGAGETVKDGMGSIVNPFDFEKMISEILFWADNKAKIPEDTYQSVRKELDKTRMVVEYEELYKEILDGQKKSEN